MKIFTWIYLLISAAQGAPAQQTIAAGATIDATCEEIHGNIRKLTMRLQLDREEYLPGEAMRFSAFITNPVPNSLKIFDVRREGVLRFGIEKLRERDGSSAYESTSPHPPYLGESPACESETYLIAAGETIEVRAWTDDLPLFLKRPFPFPNVSSHIGEYRLLATYLWLQVAAKFRVAGAEGVEMVTRKVSSANGLDGFRSVFVLRRGSDYYLVANTIPFMPVPPDFYKGASYQGEARPFRRLAVSSTPFRSLELEGNSSQELVVRWRGGGQEVRSVKLAGGRFPVAIE